MQRRGKYLARFELAISRFKVWRDYHYTTGTARRLAVRTTLHNPRTACHLYATSHCPINNPFNYGAAVLLHCRAMHPRCVPRSATANAYRAPVSVGVATLPSFNLRRLSNMSSSSSPSLTASSLSDRLANHSAMSSCVHSTCMREE